MKVKYQFGSLGEVDKAFHKMLLLEQAEKQKWYTVARSEILKNDILLLSQ